MALKVNKERLISEYENIKWEEEDPLMVFILYNFNFWIQTANSNNLEVYKIGYPFFKHGIQY